MPRPKRMGKIGKAEKALIAQVVMDSPAEITQSQINGLATGLRRSREAIKNSIEGARDNFVSSAQRYVDIHKQAAEDALANGDSEVAAKAAQWALTNISAEGARIVDKPSVDNIGSRIMIGFKIGGMNDAAGVKVEKV